MNTLVIASHDNQKLSRATLPVVTAAQKIGGAIHMLIAGQGCVSVAKEAAQVTGVEKILLAEDAAYEHQLAENMAPLIVSLAENYSHILVAATSAPRQGFSSPRCRAAGCCADL